MATCCFNLDGKPGSQLVIRVESHAWQIIAFHEQLLPLQPHHQQVIIRVVYLGTDHVLFDHRGFQDRQGRNQRVAFSISSPPAGFIATAWFHFPEFTAGILASPGRDPIAWRTKQNGLVLRSNTKVAQVLEFHQVFPGYLIRIAGSVGVLRKG